MSTPKIVVCPHCHRPNRVPEERLGDGGQCGHCQSPLFDGTPTALNAASFDRHVERSELPILVDFWAPWCGPCRAMAPAFAAAARQLEPAARLAKVNTEEEQGLAARFGIRSIPTLVVFRNGREIARQAGAMDTASIVRWLRSLH
ncbi:MAG: Thioredoxin-2 [Candidatus Accumulibacter regalis]|jgi:thioredoxin 2|uniref:Thioredoxin n=1 Tax=Accumulibacter regalis TaxID=522306 RepID=A0A011QAI1_ACCRE|nr:MULTISPECIES: thioredoxin TrxC [unclassified Candidatus Accumulibacter]EXI86252.1 MAG: Thioredoxin-2 [Candidatus Accumulibacter regalis]MQM32961.1 thioredoxin TrxC [Candidatus Accumulibacter phosphatis]MBN8515316.1 thioredoxin TrxC [Accumulibacter sp.]MBO3703757.1 thioredoxin TrxC [Accumulibacter sp.]HRE71432.1 thioredoxin TrxC [Accumulibacter sp.]